MIADIPSQGKRHYHIIRVQNTTTNNAKILSCLLFVKVLLLFTAKAIKLESKNNFDVSSYIGDFKLWIPIDSLWVLSKCLMLRVDLLR